MNMPTQIDDIDLSGQIAVVTGGGRGLGRAMAQRLAAAGASVAVVARSQEQLDETVSLITQASGRALAIPADVSDWESVEKMARQVEAELGSVDILVNNAGLMCTPGPIWEADPQEWQRVMDINLNGAFFCTRAILPGMIQRRRGRIINVASGAALGPITYGHVYCISKAALARFTECLSADAQAHGIAAFTIDPGSVRTAMAEYLIESEAGRTYLPWFREYMLESGGLPADLSANLVTLLASGKADGLSGRFIRVSDDADHMLSQAEAIQKDDLYTLRLRGLEA
jgi:NAD(P)-dependent dehydrogenase (short-subunit alcohol dehydrogenase family)